MRLSYDTSIKDFHNFGNPMFVTASKSVDPSSIQGADYYNSTLIRPSADRMKLREPVPRVGPSFAGMNVNVRGYEPYPADWPTNIGNQPVIGIQAAKNIFLEDFKNINANLVKPDRERLVEPVGLRRTNELVQEMILKGAEGEKKGEEKKLTMLDYIEIAKSFSSNPNLTLPQRSRWMTIYNFLYQFERARKIVVPSAEQLKVVAEYKKEIEDAIKRPEFLQFLTPQIAEQKLNAEGKASDIVPVPAIVPPDIPSADINPAAPVAVHIQQEAENALDEKHSDIVAPSSALPRKSLGERARERMVEEKESKELEQKIEELPSLPVISTYKDILNDVRKNISTHPPILNEDELLSDEPFSFIALSEIYNLPIQIPNDLKDAVTQMLNNDINKYRNELEKVTRNIENLSKNNYNKVIEQGDFETVMSRIVIERHPQLAEIQSARNIIEQVIKNKKEKEEGGQPAPEIESKPKKLSPLEQSIILSKVSEEPITMHVQQNPLMIQQEQKPSVIDPAIPLTVAIHLQQNPEEDLMQKHIRLSRQPVTEFLQQIKEKEKRALIEEKEEKKKEAEMKKLGFELEEIKPNDTDEEVYAKSHRNAERRRLYTMRLGELTPEELIELRSEKPQESKTISARRKLLKLIEKEQKEELTQTQKKKVRKEIKGLENLLNKELPIEKIKPVVEEKLIEEDPSVTASEIDSELNRYKRARTELDRGETFINLLTEHKIVTTNMAQLIDKASTAEKTKAYNLLLAYIYNEDPEEGVPNPSTITTFMPIYSSVGKGIILNKGANLNVSALMTKLRKSPAAFIKL